MQFTTDPAVTDGILYLCIHAGMAPCSVYAVFLVFSLLCTAHGKKPHAELKCNLYADAKNQEDHGRKQLPRSKESAFLLRVIPTEESANFQYRGQSIPLEETLAMAKLSHLHVYALCACWDFILNF